MRGACREPELGRSGFSTWQGRTRAPAPCWREEAPWEATIEQVVIGQVTIIGRLSMEVKSAWVNAERYMPLGQAHTSLPLFSMLSFVLYVLRSRPSSELSCRWYARSRCRDQGQGVRAGKLVRAPESRCSGAPLLTRKRIAREKRRLVVPPAIFPRGPCEQAQE